MGMLRKSGIISESSALPNPVPSANLLSVQSLERYLNHLGNVDNYIVTSTSGTATATENGATHAMDLVSGNTTGSAVYQTKATYTLTTTPHAINILIQGLANGDGGNKGKALGFADSDFIGIQNGVYFNQSNVDQWSVITIKAGVVSESNDITALANGDMVSVVATSSKVDFYKNGVRLFTHTVDLPTAVMKLGASVRCSSAAGATSSAMSVDYINIERYVL